MTHISEETGLLMWEEGDCALVMAHVKEDSDGKTVSLQIGDHVLELRTEYTVAIEGFPHEPQKRLAELTHRRPEP